MEKKQILEACKELFDFFDFCGDRADLNFGDFCFEIADGEDFSEKHGLGSDENEEGHSDLHYFSQIETALAYSIGFVMGQTYEVTNEENKRNIETIRRMIEEEGLLPYVIKKQKAA